MKTKVVNTKNSKYDIYIGRPSMFGNPFKIGKDGTRKKVIEKYKNWFYKKIKQNSNFKKEVKKLKGKTLGCWCKPKACHGDIIVEYLEK